MAESGVGTMVSGLVALNEMNVGCPQVLSAQNDSADCRKWFVMRSTYSREMKAKSILEADGIECYIPIKREITEAGEILKPAIHNLVFVFSERSVMDNWKRRHEGDCPLRYAMDKSTGLPMIVRNKDMDDFIRATRYSDGSLLYLDNPEAAVKKGRCVEIVCGPLKGVRGAVLRVLRDRKVVVSLNGIAAVAISGIPFSCMRVIEEEKI